MLHDCLFVFNLLVITLSLVDFHCYYFGKIDDGFLSGDLKIIGPSFLFGLRCSQLRQI